MSLWRVYSLTLVLAGAQLTLFGQGTSRVGKGGELEKLKQENRQIVEQERRAEHSATAIRNAADPSAAAEQQRRFDEKQAEWAQREALYDASARLNAIRPPSDAELRRFRLIHFTAFAKSLPDFDRALAGLEQAVTPKEIREYSGDLRKPVNKALRYLKKSWVAAR